MRKSYYIIGLLFILGFSACQKDLDFIDVETITEEPRELEDTDMVIGVFDNEGVGIPNSIVNVVYEEEIQSTIVTDENGSATYTIPAPILENEEVFFWIQKISYYDAADKLQEENIQSGSKEFRLIDLNSNPINAQVGNGGFELEDIFNTSSVRLTGKVLDSNGSAGAATVMIFESEALNNSGFFNLTFTDENGNWELLVPAETELKYTVYQETPCFGTSVLNTDELVDPITGLMAESIGPFSEDTTLPELTSLDVGGVITESFLSGIASNCQGIPIPNVLVDITVEYDTYIFSNGAFTDENGLFEVVIPGCGAASSVLISYTDVVNGTEFNSDPIDTEIGSTMDLGVFMACDEFEPSHIIVRDINAETIVESSFVEVDINDNHIQLTSMDPINEITFSMEINRNDPGAPFVTAVFIQSPTLQVFGSNELNGLELEIIELSDEKLRATFSGEVVNLFASSGLELFFLEGEFDISL